MWTCPTVAGETPGFSGADLANLPDEPAAGRATGRCADPAADLRARPSGSRFGPERAVGCERGGEGDHGLPRGRPTPWSPGCPERDPVHKIRSGARLGGRIHQLNAKRGAFALSKSRFLDALRMDARRSGGRGAVFGRPTRAVERPRKANRDGRENGDALRQIASTNNSGRHETMSFSARPSERTAAVREETKPGWSTGRFATCRGRERRERPGADPSHRPSSSRVCRAVVTAPRPSDRPAFEALVGDARATAAVAPAPAILEERSKVRAL